MMELMGQSIYFVLGLGLGSVFLLRFLWAITYATFFSPLRNVPGPFLARYTDLWHLWRVWHGQFEQDDVALHKKYGMSLSFVQLRNCALEETNLTHSAHHRTYRSLWTKPIQHPASHGQQDHLWQWA